MRRARASACSPARPRWPAGSTRSCASPAAIPSRVRGEDVSAAAAAGDPAARQVIEEVGGWVGFGLANLACVLDPQCFVLGGGVVQAGDLLLEPPAPPSRELVEGAERRPLAVVVPAAFGERAGAVGAALAARQGGLG